MLGLADRGRVLDLFDMILKGDAAGALAELSAQYAEGADPMAVLRDLAEITHWVSVVKITPEAAEDPTVGPEERDRGRAMAEALPMRVLTRMWQMLLKALEEVARSSQCDDGGGDGDHPPHPCGRPALPEELVRKLQGQTPPAPPPSGGNGSSATARRGGADAAARTAPRLGRRLPLGRSPHLPRTRARHSPAFRPSNMSWT